MELHSMRKICSWFQTVFILLGEKKKKKKSWDIITAGDLGRVLWLLIQNLKYYFTTENSQTLVFF